MGHPNRYISARSVTRNISACVALAVGDTSFRPNTSLVLVIPPSLHAAIIPPCLLAATGEFNEKTTRVLDLD